MKSRLQALEEAVARVRLGIDRSDRVELILHDLVDLRNEARDAVERGVEALPFVGDTTSTPQSSTHVELTETPEAEAEAAPEQPKPKPARSRATRAKK